MQQNRNGKPFALNDVSNWAPIGALTLRSPALPSLIGAYGNSNRIKLKKLGSESPNPVSPINREHKECDDISDEKSKVISTSSQSIFHDKKRLRNRKTRNLQQAEVEIKAEIISVDQRQHEHRCSPVERRISLNDLGTSTSIGTCKEEILLVDSHSASQLDCNQNPNQSIGSSVSESNSHTDQDGSNKESSEIDTNPREVTPEQFAVRSNRTSKRHRRQKKRHHEHATAVGALSKVTVSEALPKDFAPHSPNNPLPKIAGDELFSPLRRDKAPRIRSDSIRGMICPAPQLLIPQPLLQILPSALPVLPSVRTLATSSATQPRQPQQLAQQAQPIRDELPEYREDHGPNAAVTSIKGLKPGNPKWRNQDNFFVREKVDGIRDMGLYCVLDGHGQYGHDIARRIVGTFPQHIKSSSYDVNRAFRSMQSELCSCDLDVRSSGATCVLAVLNGSRLSISNCGDSRAVLGRKDPDGTIAALPLSKDHKPENPEEHKRITASGGQVGSRHVLVKQPDGAAPVSMPVGPCRVWYKNKGDTLGLAMSRSLGDYIAHKYGVSAEPEILQHTVTSSDEFLILATDGVWDVLDNEEACRIVFSAMTSDALPDGCSWPQLAANRITSECRSIWEKRSSMVDDITVIVIKLQRYR